MTTFTHLHLHTQYSFLDGAIHVADLPSHVASLGMSACAVTEHGNLFGALDFYKRAKAAGIKPILGCEAYVADGARTEKKDRHNYHLVLLAKNKIGWKNLKILVSMGYVDGFYYKPRIDKTLLREHSEGLIGLTACLGGEVANKSLAGDSDGARQAVRDYRSIFAPGHFFLEIQENGLIEQATANACIKQLSNDEGVPLIATNDCHYKMREDAAAHDVLMCIQHGRSRNDPQRKRHQTDAFYVRSPEEMAKLFSDCSEAVGNTMRVADMVDLDLELGKVTLPDFHTPDGTDLESLLRDKAREGLLRRFSEIPYPIDRDAYEARLVDELNTIVKMNFPGYFLIVADFINWAKANGIWVGPGRGSGAGSLVAYALRITDLDPIPYQLLFERFLNPERISLPDFDVDFCQGRRQEVIDYVTQRYGRDRVGQIATFSQLKAKSVIKDVARVLEVPFADVNAITKLLPNTYKDKKGEVKPITIDMALEIEPRLRQLAEENPTYKEVIEIARRLEGLYRQAGMHAAGIVIANEPIWEVVPVFRSKDDEIVSQFAMGDVEDAGLVKFDFLGLKTLDVIEIAERQVNRRIQSEHERGDVDALAFHPHVRRRMFDSGMTDADMKSQLLRSDVHELSLSCTLLSLEDSEVYRLLASGQTIGIFQLESTGFQDLLRRMKPDCFEDIIAAVALYRPGPLQTGMVDDLIDTKHNRKKITYPHPLLEPILKPTYGGFVYQEQVMQAAQIMAGYSLGGADLLRRAMGKKKASVMAAEREKFVGGCVQRNIPADKAGEVFDLMEKFAGYGFNKSHSAAYALITYQTAYLKKYYPVEFMAALLSTELGSTENIVKYISEARGMGISVLPPTVNASESSFSVVDTKIRFGLGAIKGLGEQTIAAILAARAAGGPFASIADFCERVPQKSLTKKTLEALVRAGAFDDFQRPRAQMDESLERAVEAAKSLQRDAALGQASLFGALELMGGTGKRAIYDDSISEWPERERLRLEKEAIGFYVTGHPLDRYAAELRRFANATIGSIELDPTRRNREYVLGVSVAAIRERPMKDGSGRLAFVTLEDLTGAIEAMVPSKIFGEVEPVLRGEAPILAKVIASADGDDDDKVLRFRLAEVQLLTDVRAQRTQRIEISVAERQLDRAHVQKLKETFLAFPGRARVRVRVRVEDVAEVELALPETLGVDASEPLMDALEGMFGRSAVRLSA